ncbi:hypothetical protein [Actinoplanes sp. L3-i22]|uniref:hypothetical protein n=1 Tax=Actinoplanes sp. L3-i22 TaxID=2836373 RepID=UPI001C769263|nr:hypothetical protein [Actinoplanes sp. L3-i22]BCY14747.1 hypothetical protein L3i22_098350 [Actinoplanes sp. L3-i22]
MTTLESRYRRLLRFYPADHRAVYEEEILGVLLAGSPPGRRFPSPADAVDLLRSALTVRFAQQSRSAFGTGWRAAAAVTALLTALFMTAGAVFMVLDSVVPRLHQAPIELFGPSDVFGSSLRALAWLAVGVAALRGRHRVAALLCGPAFLAELVADVAEMSFMSSWYANRMAWGLIIAVLTGAAFTAAIPARSVLGRRRSWVVVAGAVSFAATGAVQNRPLCELLGFVVPLSLVGCAVVLLDRPVRARVVVLSLAIGFVPAAVVLTWDLIVIGQAGGQTRSAGLALAPVAIFAGLAVALWGGERFAARKRGQVRVHE